MASTSLFGPAHATRHADYRVFQQWLIITGVLVFAGWISYRYGLIGALVAGDRTYISLVIGALFAVSWAYCGVRSAWISREDARFAAIRHAVERDGAALALDGAGRLTLGGRAAPESAAADYLAGAIALHVRPDQRAPDTLVDVLGERLAGAHEFGWFICGVLIKLGLLGTVIGFIVMLATVNSATSFDVSAVRELLVGMSQGMRVALYTTLVGLGASMILSLQYLLLDRAADRLQSAIVSFAQRQRLG